MAPPSALRGKAYNGFSRDRSLINVLMLGIFVALVTACGGSGSGSVGVATPDNDSSGPGSLPRTAALTWDAATDPNVSGYRIYYGSGPGTYLQSFGKGINVGNVTTYTVTGLTSGSRYYFAVTAYDSSGNESRYSNEEFKDVL